MNQNEMDAEPPRQCERCGLTMRGALIPVHKYLHHEVELPSELDERLDAVLEERYVPEPSYTPAAISTSRGSNFSHDKIAKAVVNQFQEYLSDDSYSDASVSESPMADTDETSGQMETVSDVLPDAEHNIVSRQIELNSGPMTSLDHAEEAEQMSVSKWEILYGMMHTEGVWSLLNEGKKDQKAVLDVPLCLVPTRPEEFGIWAQAWNSDPTTNGCGKLHFVVGPTKILAVVDTDLWYENIVPFTQE